MCVSVGHYVQNAYKLESKQIVYFTDSLLNLQRLQRGKGHCRPWEERRVCYILDNKHESDVKFCPGVLNPADLPSRGCDLPDLIEKNDFWLHGPKFLTKSKKEWPMQPVQQIDGDKIKNEENKEFYKNLTTAELDCFIAQSKAENLEKFSFQQENIKAFKIQEKLVENRKLNFIDALIDRTNNWTKAVNVLSRIKRLAQHIKLGRETRKEKGANIFERPYSYKEIYQAELILMRRVQELEFGMEINLLKKQNQHIPSNSKI
jgi:hypothetical protein